MKKLFAVCAALILAVSAYADCFEAAEMRKPRNKRKSAATVVQENIAPEETPAEKKKPAETPVQKSRAEEKPWPPVLNVELTPSQMDSIVAAWNEDVRERAFDRFYENFISVDDVASEDAAQIPDSVYVARLRALMSPVQLPYNEVVKSYITRYTNPSSGLVSRLLALSKYYFPIIEDELIREGLPVELRVLPIIESALVPTAISRQGAAGLWQFMPSTGRNYGLEVNSMIDERFDPVMSTRAACRFLRDLYAIYKDWTLALAAYNCGPGNVNKALARAGSECKTFWDIYYYLPKETRGYVPAFIGATYALAYHRQHGVKVEQAPLPIAVDTVTVARVMHLEQVSSTIEVPVDMLRKLNPQYKMDIVPATTKSYSLVLPLCFVSKYVEREPEIFAKDSTYLKDYINPANIDAKRLERGVIYTVKSGDTLGKIAAKYRVTVKEIMRWNNLKSDRLRIGQKLRIERGI